MNNSQQATNSPCDEQIQRLVANTVDEYSTWLRSGATGLVAWETAERVGFEARLYARWKQALDGTALIITVFREGLEIFDRVGRASAIARQDFLFDVLLRLGVRACKTASEIVCLLRAGYSDGAHARWRSLHELASTAMFVHRAGRDTAERYFHWEVIESWRAAKTIRAHAVDLAEEDQIDDDSMLQLARAREELLNRYGAEFDSEFGWAISAARELDSSFKGSRIRFDYIERLAGMPHQRPYYKLACIPVHAGPKCGRFSVEQVDRGDGICVGPSNFGLADVGGPTCQSLLQLFATLTCYDADADLYVRLMTMEQLVAEVRQSYSQTQRQIADEETQTASLSKACE